MGQSGKGEDYYSILGADEDTPQDEIERRYKRLAVRHHPDRGGDEDEMKAINEAYRVLGNEAARQAYDSKRYRRPVPRDRPPFSSPSAQADAVGGRLVGAALCLVIGLVLLFLVRFQFLWFLWPLAILAAFVVFLGVWMAHAALVFAREGFAPTHPARRYAWAQETAFWLVVMGGAYGVYFVMTAI